MYRDLHTINMHTTSVYICSYIYACIHTVAEVVYQVPPMDVPPPRRSIQGGVLMSRLNQLDDLSYKYMVKECVQKCGRCVCLYVCVYICVCVYMRVWRDNLSF